MQWRTRNKRWGDDKFLQACDASELLFVRLDSHNNAVYSCPAVFQQKLYSLSTSQLSHNFFANSYTPS